MIGFQSVLSWHESGEPNQIEAAEMLGVSGRTFRRWCKRFEDEGEAGLERFHPERKLALAPTVLVRRVGAIYASTLPR